MLFHNCAELGVCRAATRYCTNGVSVWDSRTDEISASSQRAHLDERDIRIIVILDDTASGKNRLCIFGVVGERVTEKFESLEILSHPQVQQPNSCQELGGLGRIFEGFKVRVYRLLVLLLQHKHLAKLQVGRVVLGYRVGAHEALDGVGVLL
jgi:hypothetical protein